MSGEIPFSPEGGEVLKTKPTILVPEGYGSKIYEYADYLEAKKGTAEAKLNLLAKVATEGEIRKYMEEQGVMVTERIPSQGMWPDSQKNEYCIIAGVGEIGDENAEVKKIVPDIKIPESYTLEEFLGNPTYPVVAAFSHPEGVHGGKGIYLIEVPRQVEKIEKFLDAEGKPLRDSFSFKKFIKTPSDYFTSYRVLVSAVGEVHASALVVSDRKKSQVSNIRSDKDLDKLMAGITVIQELIDYLEIYGSPYYLKSKKIVSNVASGGRVIPLDPTEKSRSITEDEKRILAQHNIVDQKAPEEIIKQAKAIGAGLGRRMGLMVGIDFIQDGEGNFYYLETNDVPGVRAYVESKRKGRGSQRDAFVEVMKEAVDDIIKSG